jgi:hypothetical protein
MLLLTKLEICSKKLVKLDDTLKSGNNSVVECNLAKVDVAGSNPVSRSFGGIAKWPRQRSAKPLSGGSNPPAALQ